MVANRTPPLCTWSFRCSPGAEMRTGLFYSNWPCAIIERRSPCLKSCAALACAPPRAPSFPRPPAPLRRTCLSKSSRANRARGTCRRPIRFSDRSPGNGRLGQQFSYGSSSPGPKSDRYSKKRSTSEPIKLPACAC